MEEGKALINVGELSKPATVLIEKISDAIGGIFRPYQMRRVAEAEANAEKIRAVSKIEVTDLHRRAMHRFLEEEGKKQENIENITSKALPNVDGNSTPEKIENDWLINFFDKCRLVSDAEMQNLWAKVLAGEANKPGKFSKRTVSLLSSLDKTDALLFQNFCSFRWMIGDGVPLIYDEQDQIYVKNGINFAAIKHLVEIGLISHNGLTGYRLQLEKKRVAITYYGHRVLIEFSQEKDNELLLDKVLLSKAGQELGEICGSKPCDGFKDYVINKWKALGLKVMDGDNEISEYMKENTSSVDGSL
jgi:hypothetical protein